MLSVLTTALTGYLASKGLKLAAMLLPHVRWIVPVLVFVFSVYVGWRHGDLLSRAALVIAVLNEAFAAFLIWAEIGV